MMKLNFNLTSKHLQIDKANSTVMLTIAAAAIISIFALVSSKTLLSQAAFQRRVLSAKHSTQKQLQDNLNAISTLNTQYSVFASQDPNMLGGSGSPDGTGPLDGDNPRIVLDSLPSVYDFPALTSSLEKILNADHINVQGISGTDNEPGSASAASIAATPTDTPAAAGSVTPEPMAFAISGNADYNSLQTMIKDFERSIRPFDLTQLQLDGSNSSLHFNTTGNTYFQQSTGLNITTKEVN